MTTTGWNQIEADQLLSLIDSHGKEWDTIGTHLNKSADECRGLYEFFAQLDFYFEDFESPGGKNKRRQRRKASLIERKYKCTFHDCYRAYGTQAALKYHLKTKHNNEAPPMMNELPFYMRQPMMHFPMPEMMNMPNMPNMPPFAQFAVFHPEGQQFPPMKNEFIQNNSNSTGDGESDKSESD